MSASSFSFSNQHWFWPILFIALFLLSVFIWKELKSPYKKRRTLKLVAAFLAVLSLAMVALKPALQFKSKTLELAILTKHYSSESLDSLKSIYKNIRTLNYAKGMNLIDTEVQPTTIFVLGQGIAPFDLWQLESISTHYLPTDSITGLVALKYDRNPVAGTQLTIKGRYNYSNSKHALYLNDPSGIPLDSVELKDSDHQSFEFQSKLNLSGQLVYSIQEKDTSGNVVNNEPLPLHILPPNKLKILIINGFPTFETKYLKNFLAQQGHEVVVRSQLTTGHFKYEYFNTNNQTKTSINSDNLIGYDLLIADIPSIQYLSNSQLNSIYNAIANEGMGLFIQPDNNIRNFNSRLFPFDLITDNSNLFNTNDSEHEISKYELAFQNEPLLLPIHSQDSKLCSVYRLVGNGKIASSVAYNTYENILNGNQSAYRQFWTDIISFIGKKDRDLTSWKNISPLAFNNEPYHFELLTSIENPKVFNQYNSIVPLRQDLNIPSLWYGRVYPKETGWNQLQIEQDSSSTYSFYSMPSEKFESIQASDISKFNTNYFKNTVESTSEFTSLRPINPFWFYSLFLLSMAFLWLEPKL